MEFVIELMGGVTIEISEAELYKHVIGKDGLLCIPSQKRFFNSSSIRQIIPKKTYEIDQYFVQGKQQHGVLHDGTPVIRYFGGWYLLGEVDQNGKPEKIIDPVYYPEVTKDCVPSPAEYFTKYAMLPREKRKELICGKVKQVSEMVSMQDALNSAWKSIENLHKNNE